MIMNYEQFIEHLIKHGKTKAIPSHIPNKGINNKQIEVVYDIYDKRLIDSYLEENVFIGYIERLDLRWKKAWSEPHMTFKLKHINNDINFYIENLWKE